MNMTNQSNIVQIISDYFKRFLLTGENYVVEYDGAIVFQVRDNCVETMTYFCSNGYVKKILNDVCYELGIYHHDTVTFENAHVRSQFGMYKVIRPVPLVRSQSECNELFVGNDIELVDNLFFQSKDTNGPLSLCIWKSDEKLSFYRPPNGGTSIVGTVSYNEKDYYTLKITLEKEDPNLLQAFFNVIVARSRFPNFPECCNSKNYWTEGDNHVVMSGKEVVYRYF